MSGNRKTEPIDAVRLSNVAFFNLGVRYLVSGTHRSLNLLMDCDQELEGGKERMFYILKDIKEKIGIFSSTHLQEQVDQTKIRKKKDQESQTAQIEETEESDLSEMSLTDRANLRLRKANLKLKKKIRKLKISLTKVKYLFDEYIELYKANTQNRSKNDKEATEPIQDNTPHQESPEEINEEAPAQNQEDPDEDGQERTDQPPPPSLKKLKNKSTQAGQTMIDIHPQTQIEQKIDAREINLFKNSDMANLAEKIDGIYDGFLKSTHKRIQDLTLTSGLVKNHAEHSKIGSARSGRNYLALKGRNSYMIATSREGILVVENSSAVYYGSIPHRYESFKDIIYVEHLDCYLMDHYKKLWRKGIDGNPPYVYIDMSYSHTSSATFFYSALNQRLIIKKDQNVISAINLETKEAEIEVTKDIGGSIDHFRLFGEDENQVVGLIEKGVVILYELDYKNKTGEVASHYKIPLIDSRSERAITVAVCDKGRYIMVEIQTVMRWKCSRMMILEITTDNALVQREVLDVFDEGIPLKSLLDTFGYVGSHILWVSMSSKADGIAQIFDFDTETSELRELVNKRFLHKEANPTKLHRLGRHFYFVGNSGKIKSLTVDV